MDTFSSLPYRLRRCVIWFAFAALCLSVLPLEQVSAESAKPQENPPFTVYLPLTINAGTPQEGGTAFPRQPNPLTVAPQLDAAHMISKAIGPEGGVIETTAADGTHYRLTIPEDALEATETITMTPLAQIGGLPLSGGMCGAVHLEPAGLLLFEPAQLVITSTQAAAGMRVVGFAYEAGGAEFHLYPTDTTAQTIAVRSESLEDLLVPLVKLDDYGTGAGTSSDIHRQVQEHPPTDSDAQASQETVGGNQSVAFLHLQYDVLVRDVLMSARTDAGLVDAAMRAYGRWFDRIKRAGALDDLTISRDQAEAIAAIVVALDNAQKTSFERCTNQSRPEEGFAMLRWIRYHRKFVPGGDVSAYQDQLGKCLSFELKFSSVIVESTSGYGYRYELNSTVPLRATSDMTVSKLRLTGSAPLEYTSVTWLGVQGGCTFAPSGTGSIFDVESGENGFMIRPVSRTSPETKLTLTYDPQQPFETVTIACPGAPASTDTSTAWRNYYDVLHAGERFGDGFQVAQQKAGAGEVQWVYHQTTAGPGGQDVVEDTIIQIVHKPRR